MDKEILAGSAWNDSPIYAKIAEWEAWWKGHDRTFHEYWENASGGMPVRRELFRMNMAKKVCEDWASLLLNDRTRIRVNDEAGEEYVSRIFRDCGFLTQANRLMEKAFALGTGAVILRLDGLTEEEDGSLTLGEDGGVSFEFVDARHIYPISVRNGVITEAAFLSEGVLHGERYLYVERHELGGDGYVIRNEVYTFDGGEPVPAELPGMGRELHTGSRVPLFSILTPNLQNNVDESCGMGLSVFADAIDCLKGVDLAFNNFCRDIKLGGKKVFLNQALVNRDENGNVFTPDDVAQQLFVTLGDSDLAEHPMIVEHNPELRTSENAEAVQCQLDYLSFRCGLGTHHYAFSESQNRARLTATQYMGERQDMLQNAVKHQKNVERFLVGAIRALLWCASAVESLPVNPNAAVSIEFDDSYFVDTESRRSRDLAELTAGVLTPEEYRDKWGIGTSPGGESHA